MTLPHYLEECLSEFTYQIEEFVKSIKTPRIHIYFNVDCNVFTVYTKIHRFADPLNTLELIYSYAGNDGSDNIFVISCNFHGRQF